MSTKLFGYLLAILMAVGFHNSYHEHNGESPYIHALITILAIIGVGGIASQRKGKPYFVITLLCLFALSILLSFILTDNVTLQPSTLFSLLLVVVAVLGALIAPGTSIVSRTRYSVLMLAVVLFTYLATVSPVKHHPYYVLSFATIMYMAFQAR